MTNTIITLIAVPVAMILLAQWTAARLRLLTTKDQVNAEVATIAGALCFIASQLWCSWIVIDIFILHGSENVTRATLALSIAAAIGLFHTAVAGYIYIVLHIIDRIVTMVGRAVSKGNNE